MFSTRTGWALAQNRFTKAHQEILQAGITPLDLTVSNPTRAGLNYEADAIMHSLRNPAALDYDPQPKGLHSSRKAVGRYYREDHDAEVDPESIMLTTGTSEGYSYVLRLLCNAGDEILVPKPSYPLFEFLADLHDVNLVPYHLIYDHGWQIDFHSLRAALSGLTRAVVLVHPNNPTGSFVSALEQTQLNTFCRDNKLALIVDEVFLDYAHKSERPQTFVSNDEVLTFTLSGLSKISALPQMKIAWVVASGPPQDLNTAINRLEIIADTYLSMNAPIQLALPLLLGQRKNVQPQITERVRINLAELDRHLATQKHCGRLHVDGGWYATLRVPATQANEDLAIELLRSKSVLVHPGHFYDFPSDGYLVLSLMTAPSEFRQGIRRVLDFLG